MSLFGNEATSRSKYRSWTVEPQTWDTDSANTAQDARKFSTVVRILPGERTAKSKMF